jgi:hypothetical protein
MFTTAPVSVPVTTGTPMQPVRGYHVSRFAQAHSHGLISAAEFAAVTGTAGSVTPAAVMYDTQGAAMSGDRRVLGPFQTAPQALPALRPADRSFLGPESRLGQTALTSGCPDCAEAAPEGCADHREDAARAAEYQRALRSLATRQEPQLRTPAPQPAPGAAWPGGAAHQLVITATQDLRDIAIPCTRLRAAGHVRTHISSARS